MNTLVAMTLTLILSSASVFASSPAENPCAAASNQIWDQAVAYWLKAGHRVTRENIAVGNSGHSVTDGTEIAAIRGYEIYEKDGHRWMNALLYVAQCNPATGRYQEIMYSGSGAGFYPAPPCVGQNRRFCGGALADGE